MPRGVIASTHLPLVLNIFGIRKLWLRFVGCSIHASLETVNAHGVRTLGHNHTWLRFQAYRTVCSLYRIELLVKLAVAADTYTASLESEKPLWKPCAAHGHIRAGQSLAIIHTCEVSILFVGVLVDRLSEAFAVSSTV
jgi:hypothetical protein